MPVISIGTGRSLIGTENASLMVTNWVGQGGVGIDTAVNYKNQADIGRALAKMGVPRNSLFLTSKVNGCESAEKTQSEIDATLKELDTTFVDLMLIHWRTLFPSKYTPSILKPYCAASWKVLEDNLAKGVLKAIGVSNFVSADLRDLAKTAVVMPAVNQVEYNVFWHNEDTARFCKEHNITLEAYAPFADEYNIFDHLKSVSKDPTVLGIAAHHNVSAFQVAGRWVVQSGHILTFGSDKSSHQANSADIFRWSLTNEEMEALSSVQRKHLHVVI